MHTPPCSPGPGEAGAAALPFPAPQGYGNPPEKGHSGAGEGALRLTLLPNGDHVRIICLARVEVQQGCHIVRGHGCAHIPGDHCDAWEDKGRTGYHWGSEVFPVPPRSALSSTKEALCLQQKSPQLKLSQGTCTRSLTPV